MPIIQARFLLNPKFMAFKVLDFPPISDFCPATLVLYFRSNVVIAFLQLSSQQ